MFEEFAGRAPQFLDIDTPFTLECGAELPSLRIAYHTYGTLNPSGDNVLWVCHALTANSDVADWWPNTVCEGGLLDPAKYFVVCANKLGSPYGSSSPLSINPLSGEPYYFDFPQVTVRDMVRSYEFLRNTLGVSKIKMLIGGSTGGAQAMEWAIMNPDLIENLSLTVTLPKASPWIVASSEAQRMALDADVTLSERHPGAGVRGLEAARAMSMLLYRNSTTFNATQCDSEHKLEGFRAASYQRHQGRKLSNRFNAACYYRLLQSLDSHDVGRGRGGVEAALRSIKARTVVMSVDTDIMFPSAEIEVMASLVGPHGADYRVLHSTYGHDGFLIETPAITEIVKRYLE